MLLFVFEKRKSIVGRPVFKAHRTAFCHTDIFTPKANIRNNLDLAVRL